MPEIRRGSVSISDIKRGATAITEVRRGAHLVWSRESALRDDFNRAVLGASWSDVSPFGTAYPLGIQDSRIRMLVPDGLTLLGAQYGMARYNAAQLSADNGYLETRPMTLGDVFYFSAAWARASNSGNFSNAVGILMGAGHVWIATRTSSLDVPQVDCGTFQPGDRLRLVFTGRHFDLLRNGKKAGQWDDSLNATNLGSGFRSMAVRNDGAKDLINAQLGPGPRRFGPALDYMQMGSSTATTALPT